MNDKFNIHNINIKKSKLILELKINNELKINSVTEMTDISSLK